MLIICRKTLRDLLTRTMSESLILFDQQFYKQHDGVAMGSPLGPTLANVFLCYHEKIWLQNCPSEFKPALKSYKYNLLFTLLHRAFKLCSNFERFHQEIDKLKTIFENNGYPKSFVDFCIKKVLRQGFYKKESSTESLEKRNYLRPSFSW